MTDIKITENTNFDNAQTSSQELKEIIRIRILKHIAQSDAKIEDIVKAKTFSANYIGFLLKIQTIHP